MSRVSIHVDETITANPHAVLTVNGMSLSLSMIELNNILVESMWAKDTLMKLKNSYNVHKATWADLRERASDECSVGSL